MALENKEVEDEVEETEAIEEKEANAMVDQKDPAIRKKVGATKGIPVPMPEHHPTNSHAPLRVASCIALGCFLQKCPCPSLRWHDPHGLDRQGRWSTRQWLGD